ncbi:MAG: hypothetical protein U0939_01050 [Pirellulales bacterium]
MSRDVAPARPAKPVYTAKFSKAVDDLQSVLNGIPDQPALKLMTFDELKTKVSKGKGPSKRSNTYRTIGDKLNGAHALLQNATLDGVEKAGGPAAYQKQFNTQLDELQTAIAAYQKHHKGKKAEAVAPLLNQIKFLRGEMAGVLDQIGRGSNHAFQSATLIETVSDFRTIDEVLTKAIGVSTFKTATLADLQKKGGREALEKSIVAELNKLETTFGGNRQAGGGPDILAEVKNLRANIKATLDDLASDQVDGLPAEMRLADAAAALKAGVKTDQLKGVCPRFCEFSRFNSDAEVPPPKVNAGSGVCNLVQRINYIDGPRIFKKEITSDTSGLQGAWAPGVIGIDKLKDPRYGNRNVASGLVGDLLGTSVIVKSSFALTQGTDGPQVGLAMEQASGKSLFLAARALGEFRYHLDHDTFDKFVENFEKHLPWKGALSPKAMASLQKQLMDLEVCDLISGQVDRHVGNYLIEVDGDKVAVKGIDNDFAFGKTNYGGIPMKCEMAGVLHNIPHLPLLLGREMADKLKGLDFDRDFAPQFKDLLADDEIAAAKDRFTAMKSHVATLEQTNCVVDDWETWRSADGKTAQEFLGKGSIFSNHITPFLKMQAKVEKMLAEST